MDIELLISMGFNVALLVLLYLQGNLTRRAINAGRNAINLLRENIENNGLEQGNE